MCSPGIRSLAGGNFLLETRTSPLRRLLELGLLDDQQAATLAQAGAADLELAPLADELRRRGWASEVQATLVRTGEADPFRFGPYLLRDKRAEGGMGQVSRARHVALGRLAALKFIHANLADAPALERFR